MKLLNTALKQNPFNSISMIKASAPGKIHLLGEHIAVYGKPALLAAVNLRVSVTIIPTASIVIPAKAGIHTNNYPCRSPIGSGMTEKFNKIVETIIKNKFNLKKIPDYHLKIDSRIPLGAGLGSSAALSASYIAALLTFLKIKWSKKLINELTFEAEKVFHGNPSGGDNTVVVYGGLIWFEKGKLIKPLKIKIPEKLSKNIVLINTGKPKESTKEMVESVAAGYKLHAASYKKIFDHQEKLVKKLIKVLKNWDEKRYMEIIKAGEKNLEEIGVVSPFVKNLIKKIENLGGVAKICGGGGKTKATGIVLAYHPDKKVLEKIVDDKNLPYFSVTLGSEGVKLEE